LVLFLAGPASAQDWSDYLRISFIDVGQGDAILIQTPGWPGKAILIDGGPDTGNKNRVPLYLSRHGLPEGSVLDYVIATHPHEDHYKGLLDVLDRYEVRTILDAGFPKGGPHDDFVVKAEGETVGGQPSTFIRLRQHPNVTFDWGFGLTAQMLWSDQNIAGLGNENTRENNASTVIKLTFGDFSFLFMGDAEGKDRNQPETTTRYVERFLLDNHPAGLISTVLKAGHHGSETGSTLNFIRAVQPEVVVVMSGRGKFGSRFLPDQTVLTRYMQELPGVTILRTDFLDEEEGRTTVDDADGDDIFLFTDGETLRVYQAREGQWEQMRVVS
jgi:competence protein ComEC